MHSRFFALVLCSIIITHPVLASAKDTNNAETAAVDTINQAVKKQLSGFLSQSSTDRVIQQWLDAFYTDQKYALQWYDKAGEPIRNMQAFSDAIAQADKEGLNANEYRFVTVANAPLKNNTLQEVVKRDLALTASVLHYIHDSTVGRSRPSELFPMFFAIPQKRDYNLALQALLELDNSPDISKRLRALAPQHANYTLLRESLARYRTMQQTAESWETIPRDGLIRPGTYDQRLPQIRSRLQWLGRLNPEQGIVDRFMSKANALLNDRQESNTSSTADSAIQNAERSDINPAWYYDKATEKAVRTFQERSGAKIDGIIGPETITELNTPLTERIQQIIMAMERWRWLPHDLGDQYVFANIAGFYVEAVKNDRVEVRSPVIVGQVAHQTPSFSSYITNVKFYPDWSVPSSIAQRYVLEKIQENPGVIDSLGYEIYEGNTKLNWSSVDIAGLTKNQFPPLRFRQRPGPQNALGMVRFSIDNNYAIYMHDTPNHTLFNEDRRTFSSGCIRVKEREALAAFLLDGNSDIDGNKARQKFVVPTNPDAPALTSEVHALRQKIPVHLVYMTAWISPAGTVRFGQDVYDRDKKLWSALRSKEGGV